MTKKGNKRMYETSVKQVTIVQYARTMKRDLRIKTIKRKITNRTKKAVARVEDNEVRSTKVRRTHHIQNEGIQGDTATSRRR